VGFVLTTRAAAVLAALFCTLPAVADPVTQTQQKPPNFPGASGAGQPGDAPDLIPAPPVSAAAPEPVATPGLSFERQRIKRTVPLDPRLGLDGRWDLLYTRGEGRDRRSIYLDWDDENLYLAAESPGLSPVRFDIDARGDGWFRGADNLRITIIPPVGGRAGSLSTQRWDAVQNRNRPVWAASPIAASEIKVAVGQTPSGAQAILLAVPRTEAAGLERRPGADFGLFVEWGAPDDTDAAAYTPRPMLPLTLVDTLEARESETGLWVKTEVLPRRIVPGDDGVKMTVTIKNEGRRPARLSRLFVRGSQAAQAVLDAATFTGQVLMPGDTITRSFFSTVSGAAGLGTLVVAGGVEKEDGSALAALAAFDRQDPYTASLQIDQTPVTAGSGQTRTALVSVRGRGDNKARGRVTLTLPEGWTLEDGKRERDVTLSFAGENTGVYYKIAVPASARPGVYPIRAEVRIGGRVYAAGGTVAVVGAG
jgi:hypothetical protein